MQKYIVLFRGINVGGKNLLPMKELVSLLKQNKFEDISSYIQSGNVVLKCGDNPMQQIQRLVTDNFGFSPSVFALDHSTFASAVSANPYCESEGKFVHFYFCKNDIELNHDQVDKFISESEEYTVNGKVFYLHAPEGIGRSKLVANIESCLGQNATGRNLNTINKISSMLEST